LSSSFCVVLSCVGRGLATSWSLVQGVLSYVEIRLGGGEGPKLDYRIQWKKKKKKRLHLT
jgi:hypothetical protein